MKYKKKFLPIHTVEMEYSLINRNIEKELIATAKELDVKVLAFGTAGHGLLTDNVFEQSKGAHSPMFSSDNFEKNMELVKAVKKIADQKGVTLSDNRSLKAFVDIFPSTQRIT